MSVPLTRGDEAARADFDGRHLYFDHARHQLIASAVSAISEGRRFIVVSGAPGIGKSSMLHSLADHIASSDRMHLAVPRGRVDCRKCSTFDAVAALLDEHLAIALSSQNRSGNSSTTVLLLDDAEHLIGAAVRQLLEKYGSLESLSSRLAFVAAATENSPNRIHDQAYQALITNADLHLRLNPLSPKDAVEMIRHCLKDADSLDPDLFTPEAIASVIQYSGGNPGKILKLCSSAVDIGKETFSYPILPILIEEAAGKFPIDFPADPGFDEAEPGSVLTPTLRPTAADESLRIMHIASASGTEAKQATGRRFSRRNSLIAGLAAMLLLAVAGSGWFVVTNDNDRSLAGLKRLLDFQATDAPPGSEVIAEPNVDKMPEEDAATEALSRENIAVSVAEPLPAQRTEVPQAKTTADLPTEMSPPTPKPSEADKPLPKLAESAPPTLPVLQKTPLDQIPGSGTSDLTTEDQAAVAADQNDPMPPPLTNRQIVADAGVPTEAVPASDPTAEEKTPDAVDPNGPMLPPVTDRQLAADPGLLAGAVPTSDRIAPVAEKISEEPITSIDIDDLPISRPAPTIAGTSSTKDVGDKTAKGADLAPSPSRATVATRAVDTPSSAAKRDAAEAPPESPKTDVTPLIARGNAFAEIGDLASARLFFGMAATKGSGRGAMLMGKTYDPLFFEAAGVVGFRPNALEAAQWYKKAEDIGDEDANARLMRLERWLDRRASMGDREAARILEQLRQ